MTAKPRQRYMPEDKNTCVYKVWKVVDSKPFEIFIMATIVLNAIVLMVSVRHFEVKKYSFGYLLRMCDSS